MKIVPRTNDVVARLSGVEGWLYDDCVYVTAAIISAMAKNSVRGPNFEIGVFKGKYLAAVHHCATEYAGENTLTVGLDTFQWTTEQDVRDTFTRLIGTTDSLRLMRADSTKTRPDDIIAACGSQPAFISIDGDHTVWPVLSDHVLCADVLARGGVIASDDFCNWAMIGLMDGISRFFLANNRHGLVPFAFCMNKLFACHRDFHAPYTAGVIAFCEANSELPVCTRFLATRERGPQWYKNELFGAECLIV